MKLSELIEKLKTIQYEHGDIEVIASQTTNDNNYIVGPVRYVEAYKYGVEKVVADIII